MALGFGVDIGGVAGPSSAAAASAGAAAMGPASMALQGLGIAGGIAGGIMANKASVKAQKRAQEFAAWQMDHTVQARVNDLKAAGLNPMLAASQGVGSAPSGSGGFAGQNVAHGVSDKTGAAVATAAQIHLIEAQARNVESQTAVNAVEARLKAQQIQHTVSSAGELEQRTQLHRETMNRMDHEVANLIAERDLLHAKKNLTEEEAHRLRELTPEIKRLTHFQSLLHELDVPRGRAEAKMFSHDIGQHAPWLLPLGKAIGSAGALRMLTR